MTNGDRIRSFSDEQLALSIMCPVENCLTFDTEEISRLHDKGECEQHYGSCVKCCFKWLQQEETE